MGVRQLGFHGALAGSLAEDAAVDEGVEGALDLVVVAARRIEEQIDPFGDMGEVEIGRGGGARDDDDAGADQPQRKAGQKHQAEPDRKHDRRHADIRLHREHAQR